MHMGFNTTVTKYCALCHAVDKVELFIGLNNYWFDNKKKFGAYVESALTGYDLPVKCEHCGSKHTILLDEKIGLVIAKLNEKGYETQFSCDGEIEPDKSVALPYIAFKADTTPVDIFYNLPDGWTPDLDCDYKIRRIGQRTLTSIYYKYDYNHTLDANTEFDKFDVDWDVNAMIAWVDNLPYTDLNIHRIIKHPGERYVLGDIKTAFDDIGYMVIDMHAFQTYGKWVLMLEFGNGIPHLDCFNKAKTISDNKIIIGFKNLNTDTIQRIVWDIYDTGRRSNASYMECNKMNNTLKEYNNSYVKKIIGVIGEAIDIGIRNLESVGFNAPSSSTSIANSYFSVEVDGDRISEFAEIDDAKIFEFELTDDDDIGVCTSIRADLSTLDKFIKFTEKVKQNRMKQNTINYKGE